MLYRIEWTHEDNFLYCVVSDTELDNNIKALLHDDIHEVRITKWGNDIMTETKHLWEVDHPYYATEGHYRTKGCHHEFDTGEDFLIELGNADMDFNLICRWDWNEVDPDDYDGVTYILPETDTLSLFYITQRKADPFSAAVQVTKDQEDEIREWLTVRAEHLRKVWEPLL